jgi:hypothetical protein
VDHDDGAVNGIAVAQEVGKRGVWIGGHGDYVVEMFRVAARSLTTIGTM